MKKTRGKKGKYLIRAEKGLVKNGDWKRTLRNYPTNLVCSIREQLLERIPGLTEKFNKNSRYFAYWIGDDKDRLYIYVQKNILRIDLCISRDIEKEIRREGFKVHYVNNYQGRAKWLTGWQIPHSTNDIEGVVKRLCNAFERNL
jgi:hypothetical protein